MLTERRFHTASLPQVLAQMPGSMQNMEPARLALMVKLRTLTNQVASIVLREQCEAQVLTERSFQAVLTRVAQVHARMPGNMPNMESARLALMAKLAPPTRKAVSTAQMDLYEALLTARSFRIVLLPQVLAQVPGSTPSMDPARLARLAKSAPQTRKAVSIVQMDLYEALRTARSFQDVLLPQVLAQVPGSTPSMEPARRALLAKLAPPTRKVVGIAQMDLYEALQMARSFQGVLLPQALAQVPGSTPSMEPVRRALMAK